MSSTFEKDSNEKKRLVEQHQTLLDVVNQFAMRHGVVVIVNLNDGLFRAVSKKEGNSTKTGPISFTDAISNNLLTHVHKDDKDILRDTVGNLNNLKNKYAIGDSDSIEFRVKFENDYQWCKIVMTRISKDEMMFVLRKCNDEVIGKAIDDKLLSKYDALYLVDVNENAVWPAKPSTVSKIGFFSGKMEYSQMALKFAETVSPQYKQEWINLSDIEYLKKYMADADSREYIYELPGLDYQLRRLSIDVMEREDGEASMLLLSFTGIDKVSAENLLLQKFLSEQNVFIRHFLEQYISAYYINLKDFTWQVYKSGDKLMKDYPMNDNYAAILGKYICREVHPEDIDAASVLLEPDRIRDRLSTQQSFTFNFRTTSDTPNRIIQCEVARGTDSDHITLGFKDITDKVKHEQENLRIAELAKQQRYIKAFGDMVNAALWSMVIDNDNQITTVYWSDEFRTMLGFEASEEDFPNTLEAWSSRLHPDDKEKTMKLFTEGIKSRKTDEFVYNAEFRLLRKNGEYAWYHAVGRMEKTDDGNRKMYGIMYDISEKKLLEQRENELRKALEAAETEAKHTDAIIEINNALKWSFLLDKDRNVVGSSFDEDKALKLNCDYSDGPLVWMDTIHPEDKERAVSELMATIKDPTCNTQYSSSFRVLGANGKYYWVKSAGKVFPKEDGTSEFFGITMDINDQIELEEKRVSEKNEIERLRAKEVELKHSEFRASALAHIAESDCNISSFLDFYAEKLRDLLDCDQVIYMDDKGTRFTKNSDKLGEDFQLDERICENCQHHDIHATVYASGVAEMSDTKKGSNGIPVNEKCPVKSSLTRIVYLDGEACGYLAIHYILDNHTFSDYERQTLEEFANLLSMSLSRYALKHKRAQLEEELEQKRKSELENLTQNVARIFALEDNFEALYDIQLDDGHYSSFDRGDFFKRNIEGKMVLTNDFFADICTITNTIVYEKDREGLLKLQNRKFIEDELAQSGRYDYFFRMITDDGLKWYKVRVVYKESNKNNIIVGIFNAENDMESKQIAQQKKQLEKQHTQLEEALSMAQSANRAKTTFLNNMSHDIRTPMNAIIGYTGLAASHIDNKDQVRDYLSKISQSSDHLLSLINDVLDMSRIESGKMNLSEKEENLSDIIHTLRDIVQADIYSKQLDFFVDVVDVNDEDIICDKLRLNQVLLNVLSNAIKYTQPGGTVSLRVKEKTVKKNGYATYEFCIKDNGIGMSKEFLKTIYDPFTRVKSTTVSGIQGTGLGMAITKNIVDMMGGTIEITSEPKKGTEVTICFDFRLQSTPKQPQQIPELKGVRALVADDDSNTCLSICGMIEDIGMHGEWCTSGREAVIRAGAAYKKGNEFKVYIIDWLMPDMNGIETTRRIRKVIGDSVPIIILTAYDWSDIEDEAIEAGVTAFVSKPMFPSDLHKVLNSCLGKEEKKKKKKAVKYDFTGKKVLLVEDNVLNREIANELLNEYGFIVDTAEDGSVAVEKMKSAKTGDYDIVLMDVQMPILDGYEATKQIRKLGTEISEIPILAMTANAFEEDREAALKAGMNEHIPKPIDIEKLKETLAKFL